MTSRETRSNITMSSPSWRNIPNEPLSHIIELLIFQSDGLYIPLTCSHTCRQWRKVVFNAPKLWSFVDTSRGLMLTEMWLSKSAHASLHVRFSEPLHDKDNDFAQTTQPSINAVRKHAARWDSLDISFSCLCRTYDALALLWHLPEAVHLNSLTIGPMGRTSFVFDDTTKDDFDVAFLLFRKMNVMPATLCIDSYPISARSNVFSVYLTSLEVFNSGHLYNIELITEWPAWRSVFLSSPNLVSIKLWHSGQRNVTQTPACLDEEDRRVELLALKRLELSGSFVDLSCLFHQSKLAKLESLLIAGHNKTCKVSQVIGDIANVAPNIKSLTISSQDNLGSWRQAAACLQRLEKITFVEMEWRVVSEALKVLNAANIHLIRIWDMRAYLPLRMSLFTASGPNVTRENCLDAPPERQIISQEKEQDNATVNNVSKRGDEGENDEDEDDEDEDDDEEEEEDGEDDDDDEGEDDSDDSDEANAETAGNNKPDDQDSCMSASNYSENSSAFSDDDDASSSLSSQFDSLSTADEQLVVLDGSGNRLMFIMASNSKPRGFNLSTTTLSRAAVLAQNNNQTQDDVIEID